MFAIIIDYRDIYDQLKDIPADRPTIQLDLFEKLHQWKMNDMREEQKAWKQNH